MVLSSTTLLTQQQTTPAGRRTGRITSSAISRGCWCCTIAIILTRREIYHHKQCLYDSSLYSSLLLDWTILWWSFDTLWTKWKHDVAFLLTEELASQQDNHQSKISGQLDAVRIEDRLCIHMTGPPEPGWLVRLSLKDNRIRIFCAMLQGTCKFCTRLPNSAY